MANKPETPTPESAGGKPAAPRPEAVLAARYRREVLKSAQRTYRRAVREFSKDAGCTEEAAKMWLTEIGVQEPEANGDKVA